jgi:outer membrane lipoprotein-sorting protein
MNDFPADGTPPDPEVKPPGPVAARRRISPFRRRSLRWLVPVGAAAIVAVLASGVLSADAKGNLAPRTAAQLLAGLNGVPGTAFSGTVVEKAALGLPDLSAFGNASDSLGMVGLLAGSHTAKVWYAGPTKQRVALLESLGEQDVFRDGRELWQWDSNTRSATHSTLPVGAGSSAKAGAGAGGATSALVPAQAAQQLLALVEPSTEVTTDHTGTVAGRATYTLVLRPKDARSRVGSVRIALDGKTEVPLSVQIFARGQDRPALDVSFSRVDFSVPDDSNFTFQPAADVKVTQSRQPTGVVGDPQSAQVQPLSGSGNGWTTVIGLQIADTPAQAAKLVDQADQLLGTLTDVSGSWGKGKLLNTPLVTALLTDQGKVYLGAVDPPLLYQAAEGK